MIGGGRHARRWLLLALPLVLALLIYHPYRALPLDIWDYREFLPILQKSTDGWHNLASLIGYYARHGRMNLLFYVTIVVEYQWFGVAAIGWQWLRVGWMAFDVVLLGMICRRLGLRTTAGIAAAAVLVTATPAVRAWVQMMAEPQALAAILGATFIALHYRATDRWQWPAFWITGLIAIAFLSKEVVGSLGAVVLLVAVVWHRDTTERWITRRHVVLASALALVVVGEVVLLALVRRHPDATGYGMAYGSGAISMSRFGANLVAIVLPVRPGADASLGLLYPANVVALLVMVLGLTTRLRRRPVDAALATAIALGVLPALLGAAVYLPWPKFDSFYGLPFFAGLLLLYAAALNELLSAPGVRRAFGMIAVVVVPLYAAVSANRSVEAAGASLRLNARLAHIAGDFGETDTLLVLSPPAGPRALPVQAGELYDYGVALGWIQTAKLDAMLAAPCNRFTPSTDVGAPRVVYASYSYGCGRFPDPTLRIVSAYTWHDWHTFAAVHDTMTLDLAGGPVRDMVRPSGKPK